MADMATTARKELAPVIPIVFAQAKTEFLRLIRVPAFSVPVLVFPIMFYALFGLPFAHETERGISVGSYTLASFGVYAVISVALFSFGLTVANDRAAKTTVLMRATPLPPVAYLMGKVIATLAFATITLGALFIFGALAGGVRLEPLAWLGLIVRMLVGVFPFITLGFAVGYLAGPNSAAAILQLINLPMSFASGLFMPLDIMPSFVRSIAPFLPAYHFGQLAWSAMGAQTEPVMTSVLWLAGFTVAFLFVAVRAYYREEVKTFG
jgi:ABC-2 type transport system permease protein